MTNIELLRHAHDHLQAQQAQIRDADRIIVGQSRAIAAAWAALKKAEQIAKRNRDEGLAHVQRALAMIEGDRAVDDARVPYIRLWRHWARQENSDMASLVKGRTRHARRDPLVWEMAQVLLFSRRRTVFEKFACANCEFHRNENARASCRSQNGGEMTFALGIIVGIVIGSMATFVAVAFGAAAKRGDAMIEGGSNGRQ